MTTYHSNEYNISMSLPPKPLLILQFRPEAKIKTHEVECFDFHLQDYPHTYLDLINQPTPSFSNTQKHYSSVILGGSGLSLSPNKQTDLSRQVIKNSRNLVLNLVKNDFPTLGICFGTQLIAHHLGVGISYIPENYERGTFRTSLTPHGQRSFLFQKIPSKFYSHLGHEDTITDLPPNSTLLATGTNQQIHAYQLKQNIFAVAFHPEFNLKQQIYRAQFFISGSELRNFQNQVREAPYNTQPLLNFCQKYTR
jgi:GMP synthase (glutamine-hydrolysing)